MDGPPTDSGDRLARATGIIGEQTLRIRELEAANASLLAQIQVLRAGVAVAGDHDTAEGSGNPVSHAKHQALERDHDVVSRRLLKLEEEHKNCDPRIALSTKKWAEAKQKVRQWKAYVDRKRLLEQQKDAAGDGNSNPLTPTSSTPVTADQARDLNATSRAQSDHAALPLVPATPGGGAAPAAVADLRSPAGHLIHPNDDNRPAPSRILRTESSNATDIGTVNVTSTSSSPSEGQSSSDSEPVVVSARSLKRKRGTPSQDAPMRTRIKQEPNSPENPVEIKSEDFSSPMLPARHLPQIETSDLDAFTTKVTQKRGRLSERASPEELPKAGMLTRTVPSVSDGAPVGHDDAVAQSGVRVDVNKQHSGNARRAHITSAGGDPLPLQQISANVPHGRSSQDSRIRKPRRRRSDKEAASKVALLSEDGESQNVHPGVHAISAVESDRLPPSSTKLRLDALLQGHHQTERRLLTRSRTPDFTSPRKTARPTTPLTAVKLESRTRRSSPPERQLSQTEHPAKLMPPHVRGAPRRDPPLEVQGGLGLEHPGPPIRPEEEPLRAKPLKLLRLEDFKINPKFAGTNFAFSETVRGDARRCLPGCTKPECCGNVFAAFANLGSGKSDAEILEQHFGPNWEQIMGAYGKERRNALLQEARTAAFANQYGKHRNAFERRSTPPGFWRTDFPTTQEAAEDREQADAMARQQVDVRYREAMRENGRWMFRDE